MKNIENDGNIDCPQRDGKKCKGYAGAQSAIRPENRETEGRSQNLLEAILYKDNMNNRYKLAA